MMRAVAALALTTALALPRVAFARDGASGAQPEEPVGSEAAAEQPEVPVSARRPTLEPIGPDPDVMRYPPSRVRLPLILGGLGLTALAYGVGASAAAGWSEVPGSDMLYIPVAGPWIALAKNECSPGDPDCGAILYVRGALYVLSGLVQLGGLGVAAEGIFMTTEADAPDEKAGLAVTPMLSPNTAGLGISGSF